MAWLRDIDIWFADHVFAFHDQTHRYAVSLVRHPEEAEELVQEAYARLFALENWASITHPHAFTLRIVRNLAIERFRRADVVRLDQGALLQALEVADDEPPPDRVAMDRAELALVARIMAQMPPRMREALRLRRIEGLPPGQVAERMNISVSTVETHLTKALRLLVQRTDRQGRQAKTERSPEWRTTRQRQDQG
jgi:RNA polymerase sigma-70 factor (ECF subfamily)